MCFRTKPYTPIPFNRCWHLAPPLSAESYYFPEKGGRKLTYKSRFLVNAQGSSTLLPLICPLAKNSTVLCIHEVLCSCKESKENKFLPRGAGSAPTKEERFWAGRTANIPFLSSPNALPPPTTFGLLPRSKMTVVSLPNLKDTALKPLGWRCVNLGEHGAHLPCQGSGKIYSF